jgi:hypothetical protein
VLQHDVGCQAASGCRGQRGETRFARDLMAHADDAAVGIKLSE